MMTRFASLAAILSLLAGCGGPPPPEPPEGFTIAIRFDSIDIAILESARIRFHPPPTTRFAAVPDTEYEGGEITLTQDPDSSLLFELSGAHVRDRAMPSTDGPAMVYELQIWSEDPGMFDGPLVLGTAYRSGNPIGEGTVYLPAWPPPIEVEQECIGSTCRALLPITCSPSAASMGLCLP
jgi:hypothetical protein